jgi:tetrahydromethanopterin S-methyltransferase subunit G
MAKDPDNLVLTLLRDVRGRLDKIDAKLEAHDKRFDKIDERFDGLDYKLTHVFGFAAMASLGAKHAETKVSDLADRQTQLESQVIAIDQRLRAVENPVDS